MFAGMPRQHLPPDKRKTHYEYSKHHAKENVPLLGKFAYFFIANNKFLNIEKSLKKFIIYEKLKMKILESNVTVNVQNMDKSVEFYQRLGLTLKQRWENHYALLATTDIIIGLHPAGEGEKSAAGSASGISIGFMIESIADAKALLDQHGIDYTYQEGKSGKYVHFHDLDGTVLYFTEPAWR